MKKSIFLKYIVNGLPVTIRVSEQGEITGLIQNGIDKTEDGNVLYEIIETLEQRGVNLREAITLEFEKARQQDERRAGA